jgi:hypothetical protein
VPARHFPLLNSGIYETDSDAKGQGQIIARWNRWAREGGTSGAFLDDGSDTRWSHANGILAAGGHEDSREWKLEIIAESLFAFARFVSRGGNFSALCDARVPAKPRPRGVGGFPYTPGARYLT